MFSQVAGMHGLERGPVDSGICLSLFLLKYLDLGPPEEVVSPAQHDPLLFDLYCLHLLGRHV